MAYKFNARNVAEKMWGTGGTNAYGTNRKGAYYYSCSGHGGYVIKKEAFTEQELEDVSKYAKPNFINLLTNKETGEVYGTDYTPVQRCLTGRERRRFRYPAGAPVEWRPYEFFVFEEDCDWAIVEVLTDIRSGGFENLTEEKRKEFATQSFNKWQLNKEA